VTLTEGMVIAPLIAAIATALAILLTDLVFPRRPYAAIGVASPGSRSRPRSPSRSAWRPGRRP